MDFGDGKLERQEGLKQRGEAEGLGIISTLAGWLRPADAPSVRFQVAFCPGERPLEPAREFGGKASDGSPARFQYQNWPAFRSRIIVDLDDIDTALV